MCNLKVGDYIIARGLFSNGKWLKKDTPWDMIKTIKKIEKKRRTIFIINDLIYSENELPVLINQSELLQIRSSINTVRTTIFPSYLKNSCVRASNANSKEKYLNVSTAKRRAMALTIKTNKRFVVYKCGHCDGYHFGNTLSNNDIINVIYELINLFFHIKKKFIIFLKNEYKDKARLRGLGLDN